MESSVGIASEFKGRAAVEYKKQTSAAKQEIRKKVTFNLLVKLLKQHRDCFKRYVTKEPTGQIHHPAFAETFYYCHYHIGRIGEYEWFFDDSPGTVLIYRSSGLRSIPSVEMLGCEVSPKQIRAIVEYLDKVKFARGADKTVEVPVGFYVFEFTAQERCWPGGSERGEITEVVTPFQAKNLKDAIRIMKMWPNHWCYKDISNVKAHTHEGCLKLNNTLSKNGYRQKWEADLSDYNYELI